MRLLIDLRMESRWTVSSTNPIAWVQRVACNIVVGLACEPVKEVPNSRTTRLEAPSYLSFEAQHPRNLINLMLALVTKKFTLVLTVSLATITIPGMQSSMWADEWGRSPCLYSTESSVIPGINFWIGQFLLCKDALMNDLLREHKMYCCKVGLCLGWKDQDSRMTSA